MLNNLKPALFYLAISVLLIVFRQYAVYFLIWLDIAYLKFSLFIDLFTDAFGIPNSFNRWMSLTFLPVILVMVPALFYKLIKKKNMPHTFLMIWILWLVFALSKILLV